MTSSTSPACYQVWGCHRRAVSASACKSSSGRCTADQTSPADFKGCPCATVRTQLPDAKTSYFFGEFAELAGLIFTTFRIGDPKAVALRCSFECQRIVHQCMNELCVWQGNPVITVFLRNKRDTGGSDDQATTAATDAMEVLDGDR